MSCNNFNVMYVIICVCFLEEYIWQKGVTKQNYENIASEYIDNTKQPEHQQLKFE